MSVPENGACRSCCDGKGHRCSHLDSNQAPLVPHTCLCRGLGTQGRPHSAPKEGGGLGREDRAPVGDGNTRGYPGPCGGRAPPAQAEPPQDTADTTAPAGTSCRSGGGGSSTFSMTQHTVHFENLRDVKTCSLHFPHHKLESAFLCHVHTGFSWLPPAAADRLGPRRPPCPLPPPRG